MGYFSFGLTCNLLCHISMKVAINNEKKRNDYTADVVEFDSVMQVLDSAPSVQQIPFPYQLTV